MRARGALVRISPDRAKFTFWLFALIGLYLTWRLFDIQVLHGHLYSREALEQRAQTIEIFARRGTIYDRTRTVLVRSLKSESIYADPTQITEKNDAAAKLAPILGYSPNEIVAALDEPTHFRWLKRKVSHDIAQSVRALNLQGINVVQEETGRRFWTSGRLASTVLGFVGMDENGLSGVEYSYDNVLRGTSGKMMLEADPFQRALPFGQQHVIEQAHPGSQSRADARRLSPIRSRAALGRAGAGIPRAQRFRDRHGSSYRRDSRDGQRAGFRPVRTTARRNRMRGAIARSRMPTSRDRRSS